MKTEAEVLNVDSSWYFIFGYTISFWNSGKKDTLIGATLSDMCT